MELVFEASNSLEAHMVLNLLNQIGISGRIEGESLTGGVGELQPMGFVRVMVDAEDYDKARRVVEEWDAKQIVSKPPIVSGEKGNFGVILVSFLAGILCTFLYYNTPVQTDGIDYDGNGTLDEKWTFVNYRLSKTEIDSNLDGNMDIILSYDRHGVILTSESDEDFNGVFETEKYFKNGNTTWSKSETTGDGFKDFRAKFKFGLLDSVSFINAKNNQTIKVQHYTMSKLTSAEIDTNGDGNLDTQVRYNSIEEIESISYKANNKLER